MNGQYGFEYEKVNLIVLIEQHLSIKRVISTAFPETFIIFSVKRKTFECLPQNSIVYNHSLHDPLNADATSSFHQPYQVISVLLQTFRK